MNVGLRIMEAAVEFVWWWGGGGVVGWWGGGCGVCTVIFMSNPTTVLRLCCVVFSLGL